ncbi:MAG: NAD-dependent epimerase/dehydratase family protein [Planctomycetes bacterium]|nr:NAD-dependent epimerase/dehydratase family protein [Planctomycetota bacterium]
MAGPDHGKTARPLKILVLGGTGLIGPYLVKRAVARGHQVTTFNRNKRDPNAFVGLSVEKLVGDRALGDLKALEGRDWDAVIDLWPSYPKYVRQALDVLVDHCDQYLFVSTILVYEPMDKPQADENAPVLKLPENLDPEKVTQIGAQYGALKALCEQKAEEMMPGQVTIVRPGLIVGPEDDSDRFTYWPLRIAEGGEVLAPGTPDDPMHVIDVRDLAAFLLLCVEESKVGVMNATGPVSGGMRLGEFLDEQKIAPWSDLPGWMSPRRPYGGIGAVSIERALAAGLICRPLVETARDTLAWFKATQKGRALSGGLSREKEKAALAAWHARAKAAPAGGAAGSGSGAKPRS